MSCWIAWEHGTRGKDEKLVSLLGIGSVISVYDLPRLDGRESVSVEKEYSRTTTRSVSRKQEHNPSNKASGLLKISCLLEKALIITPYPKHKYVQILTSPPLPTISKSPPITPHLPLPRPQPHPPPNPINSRLHQPLRLPPRPITPPPPQRPTIHPHTSPQTRTCITSSILTAHTRQHQFPRTKAHKERERGQPNTDTEKGCDFREGGDCFGGGVVAGTAGGAGWGGWV